MQRATKFAIGRQREKYSMQTATLQASQDRVLSNARCSSCGSSSFKQYKPGEAPDVPAATSTPVVETGSVADELTKLMNLRDAGALTDDEFAAQKARLLG
jgi:hypothetical protein